MIQMFLNKPILQKIGFLVGISVIGILLMKYRNQVITFLKCVGGKIHKLIGSILGTISKLMGKVFNYFKNKKLLLVVILTNIFAVSFSIYATMSGKNAPWNIVIGCFFCSVVFVPAFYTKEYIAWLSRGNSLVKRAISKLWDCYIYFTPLISFAVSWHLSELYFLDTLAGYEIPILIVLVAMGILWIINYCIELLDINKTAYGMKHRVTLFLVIIVHIVQLFVNIYIIFLALDHDALTQIKATTPFELCFDLTYFSAMTFLGGDGLLSPATRWVQLVVLAESYIFAIYISMIIFGILTNDQSASSVDQTENKD